MPVQLLDCFATHCPLVHCSPSQVGPQSASALHDPGAAFASQLQTPHWQLQPQPQLASDWQAGASTKLHDGNGVCAVVPSPSFGAQLTTMPPLPLLGESGVVT